MTDMSNGNKVFSISTEFQSKTMGRSPRPILLKALELFRGFTGYAVDLGCGSCADTLEMLNHGWKVCAIDANPHGFEGIFGSISEKLLSNIEYKCELFENLDIENVDFLYSNDSISFCIPDEFSVFWGKIINAININGRFAGNFFGANDEWASQRKDMTFFTKNFLLSMFSEFEIEYFSENSFIQSSLLISNKKWHVFDVIAKKHEPI